MNAIETMMEEHRLIERVLEALEAYANRLNQGEPTDRGDLCRFVEFIREYADAKHHGKEEDILFTIMVENGFSRETCPLAVMYQEHEAGRTHARALAGLAARSEEWCGDDLRDLTTHARGLASLLRGHIMKENNVLYPLARGQLPESAMDEVERRCAELERQQIEDGTHDRLEQLGRDLAGKYGSDQASGDSGTTSVNPSISPTPLVR